MCNEMFVQPKNKIEPVYLGDGVYCDFEPNGITLKANHHLNPTDTIWLDAEVLEKLFKICREYGLQL